MKLGSFSVLSQKDIDEIHRTSIEILTEIGIKVHSDSVLDLLESGGAKVDKTSQVAFIDEKLIETCIKSVPGRFCLYNRDGNEALVIGGGETKFAAGHNAIFMADPFTNERRYAVLNDVEEYAVITDHLKNVDIVGVSVNPQDVPAEITLLYAVKALFENTNKPLWFSTESAEVNNAAIEMMRAVAKNNDIENYPNAVAQLSSTSPLWWERSAVEALVDAARNGVPVDVLPAPISGFTSPYSVAGLLTMQNAEVLSGIVIAQLARKGSPLLHGSSWVTYNMRSNSVIIGSPEAMILCIAGCQMAKHYGIPMHTTAPNSDANIHDEQMAWEKAFSILCSAGAGNDVLMNAGMFATGLSLSLEQVILDDELFGYVRRICRGMDVTKESIDFASIKEVGHGGNFMMEDLTLANLRSGEFHEYQVSNIDHYDKWCADGMPSVVEKAHQKLKAYLDFGSAHPIDDAKKDKLEAIIKAFN